MAESIMNITWLGRWFSTHTTFHELTQRIQVDEITPQPFVAAIGKSKNVYSYSRLCIKTAARLRSLRKKVFQEFN